MPVSENFPKLAMNRYYHKKIPIIANDKIRLGETEEIYFVCRIGGRDQNDVIEDI